VNCSRRSGTLRNYFTYFSFLYARPLYLYAYLNCYCTGHDVCLKRNKAETIKEKSFFLPEYFQILSFVIINKLDKIRCISSVLLRVSMATILRLVSGLAHLHTTYIYTVSEGIVHMYNVHILVHYYNVHTYFFVTAYSLFGLVGVQNGKYKN
jgi:hypothetical protein